MPYKKRRRIYKEDWQKIKLTNANRTIEKKRTQKQQTKNTSTENNNMKFCMFMCEKTLFFSTTAACMRECFEYSFMARKKIHHKRTQHERKTRKKTKCKSEKMKKRERDHNVKHIKCWTTHSHLFKRPNVHLLCKSQFSIFSMFWLALATLFSGVMRVIVTSIQFDAIFSRLHTFLFWLKFVVSLKFVYYSMPFYWA